MTHQDRISVLLLKAQERMFRLAARDCDLTIKAISLDSGIPYNTLRCYAGHKGAQAMMPVSALLKLVGVIPDELLSHLFEPVGRHLVEDETDDGDHDSINPACIDFTAALARARHPDSPEGVNIAPCEDKELRAKRVRIRSAA